MSSSAGRTVQLMAVTCATLGCSTDGALSGEPLQPAAAAQEFSLRKGKDIEVCESYLEWLNRATYTEPPYCGRPEPLDVNGFEKLRRVSLTPDEVMRWVVRVWDFSNRNDQDLTARFDEQRRAQGLPEIEPVLGIDSVTEELKSGGIFAWRYDPEVDVDNDGAPEPVLSWRGYGANPGTRRCGQHYGHDPSRARQQQLVLIVDRAANRINEEQTRLMFEHPLERNRQRAYRFHPIGDYMGLLRFKGKTYFDAFLSPALGDAAGARKGKPELADTLVVFERSTGTTHEVCEFLWNRTGSVWGG